MVVPHPGGCGFLICPLGYPLLGLTYSESLGAYVIPGMY